MAAKRIVFSFAGTLLVGGMFLVGGRLSWAAEPSAGELPLQPIPSQAPGVLSAPAAADAQPAAGTVPGSAAGNPQPAPAPSAGQEPAVEDQECSDFCGMPCCSPPGRFWLRGDFLMWWSNGTRLPPLVTTSPQGTPANQAGVLGLATTTVLFGDQTVANGGQPGFRTTLGMWLDCCHRWDLEFDYLNLGEQPANFSQFSTGNPILARPFYDVQGMQQSSQLVAYPGVTQGTVSVNTEDYFQSAGVSLSYCLCCCNGCEPCDACDPCAETCCGPPPLHCCRTDLLVGYRYYNLSDSVAINENLQSLDPATLGFVTTVGDSFRAYNDFHGSEVGLRTQIYRGHWSLELLAKVAVGDTHEVVDIQGTTTVTAPGQPTQVYNGGILAVPSNEGSYARDVFTMIPQLGAELGYQWNCHLRTYIGYNLLYWGNVMRSADQIDLNVDPRNVPPTQSPATPFPAFPGRPSSFSAQGSNVGVEYRF